MKYYSIRKILPGMFTLGNLFCGFLAVINTFEGAYVTAAWWIIIAAIFDALDGKVARLTGGSSEFGIGFATKKDILRSVWFISHIIVVICYPDEVFFPTGILYLLSGPAVYISAPAVNHVFHKADSR